MSLTLTIEDYENELDVLDETDEVASLEAAVTDLEHTLNNIISVEGVSKNIIKPYENILTNVGGINAFTTNPTSVNLEIALETLDDHSKGLIAALLLALGALMAKIISWLLDLFINRNKNSDKIEKAVDNTVIIGNNTEELIKKASNDVKLEIRSKMEGFKESYQESFNAKLNVFSKSILDNDGLYSKLIKLLPVFRTEMDDISRSLKGFMDVASEVRKEFIKSPEGIHMDTFLRTSGNLAAYNEQPTLIHLQREFKEYGSSINKEEYVNDIMRLLHDVQKKQMDESVKGDIDNYVSLVLDKKWKPSALDVKREIKSLSELERRVKDLEKVKLSGIRSTYFIDAVKSVVKSIRSRVTAIQIYFNMLNQAFREESSFLMLMTKYVNSRHNFVSKIILTNGSDEDKESLQKSQDDIKKNVKKL